MEWIRIVLPLLILLLLISFCLPLRFHLEVKHQQSWKGKLTISLLRFAHTIELPAPAASFDMFEEQMECIMEEAEMAANPLETLSDVVSYRLRERWQRTSFKIEWRGAAVYAAKVLQIISRHSHVEHYQLRCSIGCSRPDCTAYLYGLFWTVLSAIPQQWLAQGSVSYLPDFQQKRQDVFFQGIIRCRVGQLMYIIAALFWLTAASIRKQQKPEQAITREYGEEQMAYES